ncbi:asparagine synthase (glutamine-hydrolyzing) [Aureispira anguillae]|uniref:asparagine synthase (glutamine-hydrolyzing) n=1 Tax=Aureispira anguillae TaxID=2864201 RepID=A0A915YK14_9BACT|nr:asparagine synthase (glutamine-hydrolyzing) [Aureispira anguillae]BDS14660.1 asparagine synthase (glutamine-hydrolyzing) [Aureispira anguillae]
MCGISGVVYFNEIEVSHEIISDFNNQLVHRGPDGYDVWVDKDLNIGLGHRRLSILDLSEKASQPMSFANDRYWMVYNGEVYNFIELRDELTKLGHSFRSDSDSEVVLAAYTEWGGDCVNRFNGMWAIAILDRHKKELFLSRDRFGIKPFYYTNANGVFAFASESIAFHKLHGFKKEFHKNNLLYNITNPYSLEGTGQTIYKDLYQINAGHSAVLDLKTGAFNEYQWWDTFKNQVEVPTKYEDQVAVFRELVEDATRIRMRSDVPLASALSGGVDSSAVYCLINHIMKKQDVRRVHSDWQKAYNIGFPGSIFDESHFAQQVIDYTGGQGRFLLPDYSNLVDDIVASTLLFDNIYNIPIYPLSMVYGGMQQDGYKISMDGHGVDEMMFGYRASIKGVYRDALQSGNKEQEQAIRETYIGMFPKEEQSKQAKLLEALGHTQKEKLNLLQRGIRKVGRFLNQEKPSPSFFSFLEKSTPIAYPPLSLDNSMSKGNVHLYEMFHQSVLPSILRNFDRGAMQKSIEIRMPFMDWRLVSYVFSLPLESKLGGGYTKRILRDSMTGIMPEAIRTRKLKVGMSSPMPKWFGNELKPLIMDELQSIAFQNNDLWDAKAITAFVENRIKNNTWTYEECIQFWPLFNAHIITKNLNG